MFEGIGQFIGAFGQYFAIQNDRDKQSLDSQRAATLDNYAQWQAANEQARKDYDIKGLQQTITIIILIVFAIALLYIILKKR